MTLNHNYEHLNKLRAGLSVLLYPIQYLIIVPGDVAHWVTETFTSRSTLTDDNTTLRTQNQLLKAQLQKLISLEAENIRLRELLLTSKKVGEKVLIAELISVDLDPSRRLVRLNKGSQSNIYVGQPLVDAQGVLGQVIYVDPLYSTAMLITDPSHTLPVQINRNGLRAIAEGDSLNEVLRLPYLPNTADIKVGDLLLTSGLGGVYPDGYPAAKITAVQIDPSLPYATVIAKPIAHLNRVREVLLVWPALHITQSTTENNKH